MRSEFDDGARPFMHAAGVDLTPLSLTRTGRISDERYQSAVIGVLMRSLVRHTGRALHIELPRRPKHA